MYSTGLLTEKLKFPFNPVIGRIHSTDNIQRVVDFDYYDKNELK